MSLLDKIIATVTPNKTDEERAEAHARALALAPPGTWLSAVLHHHELIEAAFVAVETASNAGTRRACDRQLAALLTGHSAAEEGVIYPIMALGDQKMHAAEAYMEQSAAKVNLAGLEGLDPMSQDYVDKLAHLKNAVLMHVYQEESEWFPQVASNGDAVQQARLTERYLQEFERYMTGVRALPFPPVLDGLPSSDSGNISEASAPL